MGMFDFFSRQFVLKFGENTVEAIRVNYKKTLMPTIEIDQNNIVISVGGGVVTKANTRNIKVFEATLKDTKVLLLQSFFKYAFGRRFTIVRPKTLAIFSDAFIEKYGEIMVEFSVMTLSNTLECEVVAVNERKDGLIGATPRGGKIITYQYTKPSKGQTQQYLKQYSELI